MLLLVLTGIVSYSQDKAAQFDKELKQQQEKGVLRIEGNKLIFKTNYPADSADYIKKYQPWINELQSPYTMAFEPKHTVQPPAGNKRVIKTSNGTVISPRDPAVISNSDTSIIGPVDSKGKLAPPPPGNRKLALPPPGIKGQQVVRDSSFGGGGHNKLAPPPPGLKNVNRRNNHLDTLAKINK